MQEHQHLWDLFSMRHEQRSWIKDRYGRVPSWAYPTPQPFRAVVSEHLLRHGFKPSYPNGHTFAACLSHDVDLLLTPLRARLAQAFPLGGRALARALKHTFKRGIDPRFDVHSALRCEAARNATSTFYFLSLAPGEDGFNYAPGAVRDQLMAVQDARCEIALHGGHEAWHNGGKLAVEKKRLEEASGTTVTGYRNHFLRFALPDTWKLLLDNGFAHDSTIAYSDRSGFRNGMCHPHRPIDAATGQYLPILELPLAIMDASLFVNMKLDLTTAYDLCKRMIDHVKENHGVLTLLWHNNYFEGDMGKLYSRLLAYMADSGAWLTSSGSMADHWETTGQRLQLEQALDQFVRP